MIYSIENDKYIKVKDVEFGTGGNQTWTTKTCAVTGAAGVHDLYLKFTGGSGQLVSSNWWKFNPMATGTGSAGGNCVGIRNKIKTQIQYWKNTKTLFGFFRTGLETGI